MPLSIKYRDQMERSVEAVYDRKPDLCPVCKKHVEPSPVSAQFCKRVEQFGRGTNIEDVLAIVFQCPVDECRGVFVAYYNRFRSTSSNLFHLRSHPPLYIGDIAVSNEVKAISQMFADIYRQAAITEQNGLTEVCGCGYRRALEFLVKDYLIHCGEEEETIKPMFLGKCIRLIESPEIQVVAERAAWLGNDEVHYVRKFEELDLENLKDLIGLTVRFIEMQEKLKHYKRIMPDKS